MRFRWSSRVASAAIVTGVVLATPVTVQAEGSQAVTVHDHQYHPGALDVAAGTTVTWTNQDTAKHDIATTSGPVAIRSPELGKGESFTYTFTAVGTYQYLCTIHPDMVGTVGVTAAPTTTTTAAPAALPQPGAAGAPSAPDASTTVAPPPDLAPPGPSVEAGTTGTPSVAAAQPVAVVVQDDDLASSSRPYLLLLAAVAAVVAGSLLLLGVGRRAGGS